MKANKYYFAGLIPVLLVLLMVSCSPVTLTSWVNPKESQKVSRIVIWGMFDKLEYEKPFEQSVTSYFSGRGAKAVEALTIIKPGRKYEPKELEAIFDSTTADALLLVTYTGSEKQDNYIQPTTTIYPDYYYNYYSYYSWGYPVYYGGGYSVTTGGYWTTTTTLNLRANLYSTRTKNLLWTANVSVTDPQYVDEASYQVGSMIFADLDKHGLIARK
jgi:hypothetical protein